jgi:hypothetical protein
MKRDLTLSERITDLFEKRLPNQTPKSEDKKSFLKTIIFQKKMRYFQLTKKIKI